MTKTSLAAGILKNEEAEQRIAQRHPSKQINTAEDVAALVAFLLSRGISGELAELPNMSFISEYPS